MQRLPVESSDIVSIGYDPAARILEVEFHGERVYQYQDVEPERYAQFLHAESHGQFFSTFITRRYRYKKVGVSGQEPVHSGAVAFVTSNNRKFKELQAVFESHGITVEQLELPVDEIQSEDAVDIAVKKVKEAYKLAGRPVVVNDSFWSILALRGFPGAYMSHVARWLHAEDFLKLMEGKTDRNIVLTETYAYHDGKRLKTFSKEYRGVVTEEPKGQGLSIEQIVQLAGNTKTIAEKQTDPREEGAASIGPVTSAATDLAKWLRLQRRVSR